MHTQLNPRPSKPVIPLQYAIAQRILVVYCRRYHDVDDDSGTEELDFHATAEFSTDVELRTDRDMNAPCLPVGVHADESTRVFLFGGLCNQQGAPIRTLPAAAACVELLADGTVIESAYTRHFGRLKAERPSVLLEAVERFCRSAFEAETVARPNPRNAS